MSGRRVSADSHAGAQRFGPNRVRPLGESQAMGQTVSAVARAFAHLSDEAVVALVARSDEDALAELYDRFGRVAYGLALRVLRDDSLAEDAVQEAFLIAWRTADTFMPERSRASTWLLTLVHRRAVDLVRREQRRRTEPLDVADERAGDGPTDEVVWLRFGRAGLCRRRLRRSFQWRPLLRSPSGSRPCRARSIACKHGAQNRNRSPR